MLHSGPSPTMINARDAKVYVYNNIDQAFNIMHMYICMYLTKENFKGARVWQIVTDANG